MFLVLMKVLKSQTTVLEPKFLNPQDWQLQIQGVLAYDSGRYLCQATSHPPTAIITTLVVVGGYKITQKVYFMTNFKSVNIQKLSLLTSRGLCRGESGNWGRRKRS